MSARATHIYYPAHVARMDNKGRPLFSGRMKPYDEQDANDSWAKHYEQQIRLTKIMMDPARDRRDKRMANNELVICERKLAYWQRHKNWVPEQAARDAQEIKRSLVRTC